MKYKHTALLLLFIPLFAAAQTDYSGLWKGAIELPGMNLELSVDLKQEQGQWVGALDIPLQKVKEMKLADLKLDGASLGFKLPEVPGNASFLGKFDDKAENLVGVFAQGGQSFPMKLQRASTAQKAEEALRQQKAIATLRHLADSIRQKRQVPGLGFGIVKDGKILLSEGFGYRDLEKKLPATANTQFAIGSSTKAFTTLCMAILADQGKLEWDKPVVNYLPDFQMHDDFATKGLNPADLVCHRSGLPRHDMVWYGSSLSRREIYERLRYLPLNKSPRTTWQYNNLMFMTAGYLVEHLSGATWENFVQTNIFKPLGMTNSNLSVRDMAAYKEPAAGYVTQNKQNTRMEYRNLDAVGPAGSINSTVEDMLKWVQLHLNGGKAGDKQLVSGAEIARAHTPQMLMVQEKSPAYPERTDNAYGLGWFIYRHKGLQVVEHGGNIDGFTALVYLVPEKNLGMVLLANQNGAATPALLARYATDMLLGLEYTDWYKRVYPKDGEEEPKEDKKPEQKRIAATKPSRDPGAFAGEYQHPGYGLIEIKPDGKTLRFRYNGFDLPLEHWHYDVFRGEDTKLDISMMLNFHSDANGVVDGLSTSTDPLTEDAFFKKIAPRRLSETAFLEKLAGKYKMEEQEMVITMETRNKVLYAKVPGQPTYTLEPFQGVEYKLKGLNGYSVEFQLDEKEKIKGASFIQPEGVFKLSRVD
jgi:CubicO group peptidase (beta-lactamase class C family)